MSLTHCHLWKIQPVLISSTIQIILYCSRFPSSHCYCFLFFFFSLILFLVFLGFAVSRMWKKGPDLVNPRTWGSIKPKSLHRGGFDVISLRRITPYGVFIQRWMVGYNGTLLSTYFLSFLSFLIWADSLMLVFLYFFQTSGKEIHIDLTMGEFTNVIDGVEVSISELKAKFVPYWGWWYFSFMFLISVLGLLWLSL